MNSPQLCSLPTISQLHDIKDDASVQNGHKIVESAMMTRRDPTKVASGGATMESSAMHILVVSSLPLDHFFGPTLCSSRYPTLVSILFCLSCAFGVAEYSTVDFATRRHPQLPYQVATEAAKGAICRSSVMHANKPPGLSATSFTVPVESGATLGRVHLSFDCQRD